MLRTFSVGACEFRIERGYPVLKNDEATTEKVRSIAQDYLGEENVEELPIRMTAEDFAYYSQQIPACFYRLGTKIKDKPATSLHTNTFDIDENSLENSIGLMSYIAVKMLGN